MPTTTTTTTTTLLYQPTCPPLPCLDNRDRAGIIISRDPDTVAYEQVLGQLGGNFDEREDYIIMTNFDFFHHDIREYFDPTGGQVGYPRRVAAQKMLNATAIHTLTPEYLFETINAK